MLQILATLQTGINRLLPFATPGTPLLQDILHLAALCTALYYAPQIQAYIQERMRKDETHNGQQESLNQQNEEHQDGQLQQEAAQPPPQPAVEDDDDDEEGDDFPAGDGPLFPADDPNAEAGPADDAPGFNPRSTPSSRTVGAKKAKSLARKDQRRAYHEFMRSQGEAQRAQDAEGAREREAILAEERARRAAAESEVEARRAKEREEKRVREMQALSEELARRENAIALVRDELRKRGRCDLAAIAKKIGGGADRTWIENLVKASGLLSDDRSAGVVTILTEAGWAVEVSKDDMEAMYRAVLQNTTTDDKGRISNNELSSALEDVLKKRTASAA